MLEVIGSATIWTSPATAAASIDSERYDDQRRRKSDDGDAHEPSPRRSAGRYHRRSSTGGRSSLGGSMRLACFGDRSSLISCDKPPVRRDTDATSCFQPHVTAADRLLHLRERLF